MGFRVDVENSGDDPVCRSAFQSAQQAEKLTVLLL